MFKGIHNTTHCKIPLLNIHLTEAQKLRNFHKITHKNLVKSLKYLTVISNQQKAKNLHLGLAFFVSNKRVCL